MYKPERPKEIDELISNFTKDPLPHFFKYAKDKKDSQVSGLNGSFVNKLEGIVPNPRMNFRKLGLGDIDFKMMMRDPDIEFDVAFSDNGRLIKEESHPVIVAYCEFNKDYYLALDNALCSDKDCSDSYMKSVSKYNKIINDVKFSLSQFGHYDYEIADILVKYLYGTKKSGNKTALWLCYGDIIVENLKNHLKYQTKIIQCIDCGKWLEVGKYDFTTCRCYSCQKDRDREMSRERKRKSREKLRCHATL